MSKEHEDVIRLDLNVQKVEGVVREVLGDTYVAFKSKDLHLVEKFENKEAHVKIGMSQSLGEEEMPLSVEGKGVGLVDAFFDGMVTRFSPEYTSLSSLSVVDFNIDIKFQNSLGRKSDAFALGRLTVMNSEGNAYVFSCVSASVSKTSIAVVLDAFRFFINSERAYTQLHVALEDAKKRGRIDLVDRYQNQMATLVQATSYRQIAERLTTPPAERK